MWVEALIHDGHPTIAEMVGDLIGADPRRYRILLLLITQLADDFRPQAGVLEENDPH